MTTLTPSDVDFHPAALYRRRGWWRDATLTDDFLDHVRAQPDKPAIVSDHADGARETLTYAQLGEFVDRIAAGLVELGVRRGEIVSFQLPNWWQFAALHLACARIGAVTNAILPILRTREVQYILRQTESRVCVIPDSFKGFDYADMLLDVKRHVGTLEHVFAIGNADPRHGTESFDAFFIETYWEKTHSPADLAARRPSGDSVAQIQFTSGTTGEPKGVVHTYNTVWAGLRGVAESLRLDQDDVLLAFSPLSHTVGFYFGCSLPMMAGMTVVYQDVWNAERMLELVNRYAVRWTMAAPTFLSDACRASMATGIKTPTMKSISCAGAPVPPPLIDKVHETLGATVHAAWGMTECGAVTTTRPGDTEAHIKNSDGAPAAWMYVRIVDEQGEELPHGQVGRLVVRGASLAVTYYKRPDLFDAACRDGWFDTGDLATQDEDGYIRLCGRTKDLIIRGAENIPVVEVEAILSGHRAVREVALIAVADERLGERACAVVVPSDPDRPPSLEDLVAYLDEQGMAKPFWPEYIRILSGLPKTATGKVQKFLLREQTAEWGFTDPGLITDIRERS
jgi:cyclohexanecarboxylate-CoA ligase